MKYPARQRHALDRRIGKNSPSTARKNLSLVHRRVGIVNSAIPSGTVSLRLTWAGHEFLDAARNDTIWKKASEKIKQSGVQVTLSLLEELLKKLLKEFLGLP